jgi:hypothetical protein
MPATAKWVQERRNEFGQAHVDRCIRESLGGVPGRFYAIEAGHITGTPFEATHPIAEFQDLAVVTGASFAGFIARPVEYLSKQVDKQVDNKLEQPCASP